MADHSTFTLPPISELFKDPFENLQASNEAAEEDVGGKCEVSMCDARYNAKGDRIYLRTGTKRTFDTLKASQSKNSALAVTRFYDKDSNVEYTETVVHSQHIKIALRKIIKSDYPGVNLFSETLTIKDFPGCLFFHRNELREYGKTLQDDEAARHVNLVLEHLYQNLKHNMRVFQENVEDNMNSDQVDPAIDYINLWMVYCPGELVIRRDHGTLMIHRIVSTCLRKTTIDRSMHLMISLRSLQFDGKCFGFVDGNYIVCELEILGFTLLKDLQICPLKYLRNEERDKILYEARNRGEKTIELSVGVHHCEYHGIAMLTKGDSEYHAQVRGRIMIDGQRFSEERPEHIPTLREKPRYSIAKLDHKAMTDEEKIIVSDQLMGFSLGNKEWGLFSVASTSKVEYNASAFERLIIPQAQKDMVRAMVSTHDKQKLSFDDFVEGKGQGMNILLHGTPGVGKTLTAESIAEHVKRPLYAITAADFAEELSITEQRLTSIFDLTSHWNAILLIDEADVFLTRRSFAEIERSAIVAVFLRALEYFSGVLILTTNRATTLDPAFRSRIHLGIKYRPLQSATRRTIWRMFIEKVQDCDVSQCLEKSFLDDLATHEIDGRMIKNAVKMSHALAIDNNEPMSQSHLRTATEAMDMFGREMDEADEEDRDQPRSELSESANSRARKRKRTA